VDEIVGSENLDLLFATEYPVASRDEAIAKSHLAHREGDIDKALFYSIKALKFDPADTMMLVSIAQLHILKGNDRLAARAFNLALAQNPDHPESLQGLGILYFQAGNSEKSRQNLERAVAGDPGLWRAWNVLGILADDRREFDLAEQCYERALAVQPDAIVVLINRGYSKYLAGNYSAAARELYDVAARSNHPTAWLNLGKTYGKQGWYDEALEVFRKVENDAQAWNRTGEIAMKNRDFDYAYSCFAEAVRHSPVYFEEAEQNMARVQQNRTAAVTVR
jgi:Flp pilus assembly protein TadD